MIKLFKDLIRAHQVGNDDIVFELTFTGSNLCGNTVTVVELPEHIVQTSVKCDHCMDHQPDTIMVTVPCGHVMHRHCARLWYRDNNWCGVCRAPLPLASIEGSIPVKHFSILDPTVLEGRAQLTWTTMDDRVTVAGLDLNKQMATTMATINSHKKRVAQPLSRFLRELRPGYGIFRQVPEGPDLLDKTLGEQNIASRVLYVISSDGDTLLHVPRELGIAMSRDRVEIYASYY